MNSFSTGPISLKSFVDQMIFKPMFLRKDLLMKGALALLLLSTAQVSLLFLVKGFMAAFFSNPNESVIFVKDLVPHHLDVIYQFSDEAFISKTKVAWIIPLFIVSAGLVNASASFLYNFSQEELSLWIANQYRESIFSRILELPYLSAISKNAGEWMSLIMSDAQFLQSRVAELLTGFVKNGVLILASFAALTWIHWPSALLMSFIAPTIAWSMGRAGKRIAFFAEAFQRELGNLSATLLDIRSRFRFMKSQGGEPFEIDIFETANRNYFQMMKSSIFIRAVITPALEWFGFLMFAGFFVAWNRGLIGENFSADMAAQFFAAVGLILRPLRQLGEQIARWGETVGGLQRSIQVINSIPRLSSDPTSSRPKSLSRPTSFDILTIDQLSCDYDRKTSLRISQLELRKGHAIAIVGPSGAGKSTLMRCFAGLIPPSEWNSNLAWSDFIQYSSFVSQSPFLFHDTLRSNLVYGAADASPSDGEITDALKKVGLDIFLGTLPSGLDTLFNPVAHNLSGGQIQRLVVARAMLRGRPILLLDEAMAAIDGATEQSLTNALIDIVHLASTVLLSVTHRTTWLHLFDEVWFLEKGRIVMKGPHDSLLKDPKYRDFIASGHAQAAP